MRSMNRWDNGRDVVLAGDAAGVVAPASGEGIDFAMLGGRLAAEAMEALLCNWRRAVAETRGEVVYERPWPGILRWIQGSLRTIVTLPKYVDQHVCC